MTTAGKTELQFRLMLQVGIKVNSFINIILYTNDWNKRKIMQVRIFFPRQESKITSASDWFCFLEKKKSEVLVLISVICFKLRKFKELIRVL